MVANTIDMDARRECDPEEASTIVFANAILRKNWLFLLINIIHIDKDLFCRHNELECFGYVVMIDVVFAIGRRSKAQKLTSYQAEISSSPYLEVGEKAISKSKTYCYTFYRFIFLTCRQITAAPTGAMPLSNS
jgi:hypothetical protein